MFYYLKKKIRVVNKFLCNTEEKLIFYPGVSPCGVFFKSDAGGVQLIIEKVCQKILPDDLQVRNKMFYLIPKIIGNND